MSKNKMAMFNPKIKLNGKANVEKRRKKNEWEQIKELNRMDGWTVDELRTNEKKNEHY